jgi:hypothetical protein
MRGKNWLMTNTVRLIALLLLAVMVAMVATSCGGGEAEKTQVTGSTVKLPPGATGETLTETPTGTQASATQGEQDQGTESKATTTNSQSPTKSAVLSGVKFTVVSAKRESSNKVVLTSGQREVQGDYLEIELSIENVGSELVDLSRYSFRLWNPAIAADQYYEYYGSNKNYGGYISENTISATLLDYATLQPVKCKLKIGEKLEDVFLFFDLNPLRTSKNEGVTKEGTNLILHDKDTGEEVGINLAGYAD